MNRAKMDRLQDQVRAHVVPVVGSEMVDIRVVDVDGEPLVIAHVVSKAVQPAVLQIVRHRFPGIAIKFEQR